MGAGTFHPGYVASSNCDTDTSGVGDLRPPYVASVDRDVDTLGSHGSVEGEANGDADEPLVHLCAYCK